MSKIPPSNVGPMSQQWADWITQQTVTNREAIDRLGGDTTNDGRINNSQMDLISSQINEIYQRKSGILTLPAFTTAAFGNTVTSVSHNRTFNLPGPTDARRIGWLNAQITAVTSNTSTVTAVDVSMKRSGTEFFHDARPVPDDLQYPSASTLNWVFNGYTSVTAGPGGTVPIRLDLFASAFTTGARSITYRDITLMYQWGQKV